MGEYTEGWTGRCVGAWVDGWVDGRGWMWSPSALTAGSEGDVLPAAGPSLRARLGEVPRGIGEDRTCGPLSGPLQQALRSPGSVVLLTPGLKPTR